MGGVAVMATNTEANNLGFATPNPSTIISTGDDHISQNARAAVELFRTSTQLAIAAGRNAAITEVLASQTIIQDDESGRLYYARATPPIMADNFDRPNESPVSPTPIGFRQFVNGAAPFAGTWRVVEGQLAPLTLASDNSAGMWNSGQSDGVLRVTVADTGYVSPYHGAHVFFRSDDAAVSNGWIIIGTGAGSGTQYTLRRRVGGAYSTGYDVGLVSKPTNGDQFEITLDGPQITVKINGVTRHDAAYPELSDTGVHHGVGAYTGRPGVRFDNVSFEQIGA